MVPYEFKSEQEISHGHAGLGSGKEFSIVSDNSRIGTDKTRGKLYARLGWGKRADGTLLAPPPEQWKGTGANIKGQEPIRDVFDRLGNVDPVKLEEWLLNHRIDPNDPRNAELMSTVVSTRKSFAVPSSLSEPRSQMDQGYFRLDQMDDQFSFCSEEQLNNNVRFQIIQLRSAKAPDFRNYRMIPSYDKEIPKGILESYAKKLEYRQKDVTGSSDQLRGKNCLYLEQLRTQVAHKFSIAKHRKRRSDMIVEDSIPNLSTLFMLLGGMAPEQRPLRPVRQERKKVTLQDLTGHDVKVLLSVVRAYDVPVRQDGDTLTASTVQLGSNGPKESKVNSFISASLQNSSARTSGAAGPNPTWNQQIQLQFKPLNNDFSPDSMRRVRDSLHLHLFDEVLVDLVEEEQRATEVHQRIEHRWMGSLSIPFTSIYQNTRIEGTFRLHSPPVLLGYERLGQTVQHLGWRPASPTEGGLEREATYLNIYLTLEPALNVPEPVREKLECEEEDGIVETCERWSRALNSAYPHRYINPLVIDVNGRSVLMTRYLRGIAPPSEVGSSNEDVSAAEAVAWFVSTIPYLPSNALFPGLGDIWPTSEHFLQMMVGSELEHAVLLANYFLGMEKTCYLLLGKGIPEGRTAYVLSVEENGQYWLWNPVTSQHFTTNQTFLPLQSVWLLANQTNVWANMQMSDQPQRLRLKYINFFSKMNQS